MGTVYVSLFPSPYEKNPKLIKPYHTIFVCLTVIKMYCVLLMRRHGQVTFHICTRLIEISAIGV